MAAGTIEEGCRYSDAGQMVVGSGRDEVPFGIEGWLGAAYLVIGQPGNGSSGAAPSLPAVATHTRSPGHASYSH